MYQTVSRKFSITPTYPVSLAGYSDRKNAVTTIADPIECNLLLLVNKKQMILFVSYDLLYVPRVVETSLEEQLRDRVNQFDITLFVTSSHTHFAPAVDKNKPLLGDVNTGYLSDIISDTIDVLNEMLLKDSFKKHSFFYGESIAYHAMNRRLFEGRTQGMFPNFSGFKDETIKVLLLGENQDNPEAIVWNYACHPNAFPCKNQMSADYPGVVRQFLRDHFKNQDLPVLFFQGFSGDIRPNAVASKLEAFGCLLKFKAFSLDNYKRWSVSLANCVLKAIKDLEAISFSDELHITKTSFPLDMFLEGSENNKGNDVHLKRVSFGSDVELIGLSAEVMNAYVPLLQKQLSSKRQMFVGCLSGTFGYFPTEAAILEGGYEAKDSLALMNLKGRYRKEIQQWLLNQFEELFV